MTSKEQIRAARKDLGAQLAAMRQAAKLSQIELGRLVGYSRSAIANVETGRENIPRSFWADCDQVLNTGGTLLAAYDQGGYGSCSCGSERAVTEGWYA